MQDNKNTSQIVGLSSADGNSADEETGMNFNLLIDEAIDKWYLILLAVVFFTLIGAFKALTDKPVYKADAMLQVEENKAIGMDLITEMIPSIESKEPAATEIELINSRRVLGNVVKNLKLDIVAQATHFPAIGSAIARRFDKQGITGVAEPLFGLDRYAWGGEEIIVNTLEVPEEFIDEKLSLVSGDNGKFSLFDKKDELLLEGLVGNLSSVDLGNNKGKINLFVSELKARPGTRFILVKKSFGKSIEDLKDKLSVTEKVKKTGILSFTYESSDPIEAAKVINEVANIYVQNNVEEKSEEAQKTLEFLNKQLPVLKEQLESASIALNEYRTNIGTVDLDTETQAILTNSVEIQTEISSLQQKREELRASFTQSHPQVITIDKQIARLKSKQLELNKKIEILPETQKVILSLTRDVEVSSELYKTLLNNAQTLRVAKAGTVGNVRIIDSAVVPNEPIRPKKMIIVVIAFALGLFSALAILIVQVSMRKGIHDPDLLESTTGIPVYANVYHSKAQVGIEEQLTKHNKNKQIEHDPCVLALSNPDDLAIESLRSLRTVLHFAFLDAKNNILMISGPTPDIGKSFVSINLAVLLADLGKKVLLIDADLRKGIISSQLGVTRNNGLSDVITNRVQYSDAIENIGSANIDFMSTGVYPPNPSELLMNERFSTLLETVSKQYDMVVIDSPPILAVTDASIIGRLASVTLMVVRAGIHPIREIEQSNKRFVQSGVSVKGFVFNDIPLSTLNYGGYGRYGYVYQYKYQRSKTNVQENI